MEETITELEAAKTWDECRALETKYSTMFAEQLNSYSAEEMKNIEKLLISVVRLGYRPLMDIMANRILEKRKAIDWKNRPDLVRQIVDVVKANAEPSNLQKNYFSLMTNFLKTLQTNHVLVQHFDVLFEVVELSLQNNASDAPIHTAALPCLTQLPWQERLQLVAKGTVLVVQFVKNNPNYASGAWPHTIGSMFLTCGYRSISNNVELKAKEVPSPAAVSNVADLYKFAQPHLLELFEYCVSQEWTSDTVGYKNLCHAALRCVMEDVLSNGNTDPQILKPFMSFIKDLWTCGDEIMERDAGYIIVATAAKDPSLVADQLDTLLSMFFSGSLPGLISSLKKMYEFAPDKFESKMDDFFDLMDSKETYKSFILPLLASMAKRSAHLVTPKHVETVVSYLKHPEVTYLAIMYLEAVAAAKPDQVLKFESDILNSIAAAPVNVTFTCNLLTKLATDEERATKYLNLFAGFLNSTLDDGSKISLLYSMRTIGNNYRVPLAAHRALIDDIAAQKPSLKQHCQALVDVIENRSLETVANEVQKQNHNVAQLSDDVAAAKEKVGVLAQEVDSTGKSIGEVKQAVKKQGEQIDNLQEAVSDTVQKVDTIDKKTLSHAPAWSPAVCKLLNEHAEHDWRSVATRLGYSNEDIRNWATQSDPCLSLLDEWFATHKTREATYAVYHTLRDINRTDAARIVEEALKSVQNVVLDDEDKTHVEVQPIFLSYQWAHQQQVKLLRQHLSMAGYAAWMDIGQMGGGDKLFAKIDAALRSAKVVVCCVTEKYAQSTNCNREVTLAVTLGKPIIPILLQDTKWPPEGAMGPIFSEYLYIQFFKNPPNDANVFWNESKFSELLMQLRYSHSPDTKLITSDSPYKNWWQPSEEIHVSRSNAGSANVRMHTVQSKKATSELFISYQWDMQSHVKLLYRRLTELGYSCWLDVMQMGGGDSLFDKIDRGIRSCSVVLCCVTQKYTLSANCRREVSLSDALKKPIVPLLLEKMPWPPQGPMGPAFTQLNYLDFSQDLSLLTHVKSAQFDELISKVEFHKRLKSDGSVPGSARSHSATSNHKLPSINASSTAARSYASKEKK